MKNIDITELRDALIADIQTYTTAVVEDLDAAVEDCIKYAEDEARANSPVKSGAYKGGWYSGVNKHATRTVGYAANRPGRHIAHLLEKGHKARNGKFVKAIPHIIPAQDKAMEKLNDKIETILSATK